MGKLLDINILGKIIDEHGKIYNIDRDLLEKDYYLTLLLLEVSELQKSGLPVVFKGGTSIYKRYEYPVRFSEGIDLTINLDGKTNSQKKKILEDVTQKYNSLNRTVNNKHIEFNKKGVIQSVYDYKSLYNKSKLEKFIIVETSSFTVSEPVEIIKIKPLINDTLIKNNIENLEFNINAIKLERIFMDKIFASESMIRKRQNLEIAKHIFDIFFLLNDCRVINMLDNCDKIREFSYYRLIEGDNRLDSEGVTSKFDFKFELERYIKDINLVNDTLNLMQERYLIKDSNKLYYNENNCNILLKIFKIIKDSWENYDIINYNITDNLEWN